MKSFTTRLKLGTALLAATGGLLAASAAPAQADASARPCAQTLPTVIFETGERKVSDGLELREIRGLALWAERHGSCVYWGVGLYFDPRFNMLSDLRDELHVTPRR